MLSKWNKFPVIWYLVLTILYYLHDSVHLLISIAIGIMQTNLPQDFKETFVHEKEARTTQHCLKMGKLLLPQA